MAPPKTLPRLATIDTASYRFNADGTVGSARESITEGIANCKRANARREFTRVAARRATEPVRTALAQAGLGPYVPGTHRVQAPSLRYAAAARYQGTARRAFHGRITATAGRSSEVRRPGLSMNYGTDRTGQRNPVAVHEFENRQAFRAALRRGDIPHGAFVAFNNATGRREVAEVLINYKTRTFNLISVR